MCGFAVGWCKHQHQHWARYDSTYGLVRVAHGIFGDNGPYCQLISESTV